jgi:hypothetical protein
MSHYMLICHLNQKIHFLLSIRSSNASILLKRASMSPFSYKIHYWWSISCFLIGFLQIFEFSMIFLGTFLLKILALPAFPQPSQTFRLEITYTVLLMGFSTHLLHLHTSRIQLWNSQHYWLFSKKKVGKKVGKQKKKKI